MKKKICIIVILLLVICLTHQGIAQEKVKLEVEPELTPEVSIDHPVFTFESVPEGVHVLHEFIIKNKGDALLHIRNVQPP